MRKYNFFMIVFFFLFIVGGSACKKENVTGATTDSQTVASGDYKQVLPGVEKMFLYENLTLGDELFADTVLLHNMYSETPDTLPWRDMENPDDQYAYVFVHMMPRWYVLESWRNYTVVDYEFRQIVYEQVSSTKVRAMCNEYLHARSNEVEMESINYQTGMIFTIETVGTKWKITEVEPVDVFM